MALTEKEELELLELENENVAVGKTASPSASPDQKPGILTDIDRSLETNEQRVGAQLAQPEQYRGQHALQAGSGVLSEIPAAAAPVLSKTVAPVQRGIFTGLKKAAEFVEPGAYDLARQAYHGIKAAIIPPVANAVKDVREKHPLVSDLVGLGMNALNAVPIVGGSRVISIAAPEMAAAARTGMGEVVAGLAGKMERGAARIEGTKVKINTPEMKQGAKNEYYTKYGVFGNANEVHTQWKEKIGAAANDLAEKLKTAAEDPENMVNISGVLARARDRLSGERVSRVGAVENEKVFNRVLDKVETPYLDEKGLPKEVDLLEAQLLKRYVGKSGDWLASPGGNLKPSIEASAEANVYNTIYDELKRELENKGGAGVKELNKAMSEMIPMERAAGKQILISNRKNPFSFDDFIGGLAVAGSAAHGNLLPAVVVGANVASKSPNVAKGMLSASRSIKGIGEKLISPPVDYLDKYTQKAGYKIAELLSNKKSILGNERGEIGASYNVPALKDPLTGEVYVSKKRAEELKNITEPKKKKKLSQLSNQ